MMGRIIVPLAFAGLLGSGLIAGVFFAFSTFVMKALARRPAAEGMGAMQEINVVVMNPMFLGVFLGTAAVSAAAMVVGVLEWERAKALYLVAGGALYLVGTFGVTMACNVPLNDRLAKVSRESEEGVRVWVDYLRRWTLWNHVRTIAAVAAAGAFAMGLR